MLVNQKVSAAPHAFLLMSKVIKEDDWEIVAQLMQFFCWNERL